MKKNILLLILLLPVLLFGQTADEACKLGPLFTNTTPYAYDAASYMHSSYNSFSFSNPSVVISVRIAGASNNQIIHIQRFDQKNLTELSNNKYNDLGLASFIVGFSKTPDALYLLYSIYKGVEFYARKIDINTGVMGESKLLFKGPALAYKYDPIRRIQQSMFKVSMSVDSSKVLISYTLNPKNTNNNINQTEAGYHVFSNSMDKIWNGVIKMPYAESSMNKLGLTISNKGDVHQLIYSKESQKFEIIIVKSQTDIKVNKLEIGTDLKILTATINETPSGNFSCTGLYRTGLQDISTQGMLRFQVDKNMQIIYSKRFVFDDAFTKEIGPIKTTADASQNVDLKNKGIPYLTLFQIYEYADATSLIVCEQQYFSTSGDIILVKVNKSGNVTWMVKIPKATKSLDEFGKFYNTKESLLVFFMDDSKNARTTSIPVGYSVGYPGDLVSYKINLATGDYSKQIIFSTKSHDISGLESIIGDLTMIDDQKFATTILTKKGDQKRIIKISIK